MGLSRITDVTLLALELPGLKPCTGMKWCNGGVRPGYHPYKRVFSDPLGPSMTAMEPSSNVAFKPLKHRAPLEPLPEIRYHYRL
jgi:hypothetical protein